MFKLIPNSVWKLIQDELEAKRQELREAHARIDRLTEAVAKKAEIPLIMPQLLEKGFIADQHPAPQVLEPASGWFDTKPIPPPKGNLKP